MELRRRDNIDFTLAFPQADVDAIIYMEVPIGCTVPEGDYVCLLKKNLHIAIKYHHFRERVQNGTIVIKPVDTNEQIADQFTKGLQIGTFKYLRSKLLGW